MEIVGNAVIQKDGTLIQPQEVIQRLELKFGDELFFVAKGGEIAISKLPDAMKRTVDYYLAIGCDRLAAEYYAGGRKRLTGVKANPDFTLTLTYEEREERIYDCKPLLDKGGVFVHLRKYENFARVFIEYGAVCWDIDPNVDSNEVWNNRIDLCPDSCYIDSIAFGEEFAGKIEVHHIKPISEIGEEYAVDPVRDLVPVCPNCHMMLHSKAEGVYSVEELKCMMKR